MAEKECIERMKAQDGLDNIDWYHVNDKGQLLPGGKSDIETYVPFKAVEEMLKTIPAADVRPVVKAKWVYTDMSRLVCSNCGNPVAFALKEDGWHHGDYCSNCGARMEVDTNDS